MKHPSDDTLAGYAAGSASQGASLLVASHMTFCPRCRDRVAAYEAICGVMLGGEPVDGDVPDNGQPFSPPDLDVALRAIDGAAQDDHAHCAVSYKTAEPRGEAAILPRPVLAALGPGTPIRWRFRMPGLGEHVIDGFCRDTKVSLLRARPGTAIPNHRHEGIERTLVLSGLLRDGEEVLGCGDVSEEGPGHDHRPVIEGDEDCICLIVLDAPLRFTGALGVLNFLQRPS